MISIFSVSDQSKQIVFCLKLQAGQFCWVGYLCNRLTC